MLAMVGVYALLYYLIHFMNLLQPLVDVVPKSIGKRVGAIVAFILVAPIWLFFHKRIKPPLFEMDISSEGVHYKFRDVNYANDFEKLNQTNDAADKPGDELPGGD